MHRKSPSLSGLITDPAASTAQAQARAGMIAIQWVFPGWKGTPIGRAPTFLGRDSGCDTPLPGRETSRRHAEVKLDGPVPVIRDLQSRNGVFVNGMKAESALLRLQDVVRLGEWVGVVVPLSGEGDESFRSLAPGWYGSAALAAAMEPARRIATADLPVIIQGETGTGKEGAARAIHGWSGRSGSFVAVNCAAIPAELAEAELFGYRKGAFTGASRGGLGYFRAADGGTLFLDEIADLPTALQPKLLRALEYQEVSPIGEARPVRVDVRLLCATQEPLGRAVDQQRFRPDLLARLDGLTVYLPPLRQRREDIAPLLLECLRDKSGGHPPEVEPRLIEQLLLYDWPLNVRELTLLARRLLALHGTDACLKRSLLPERILAAGRGEPPETHRPTRSATQDERAFESLVAALRETSGNVAQAAARLGISRARAYRLLDARPDFELAGLREEGQRE